MTYEADVHGGMIAPDGKKLYDLNKHLESGECMIQGDEPIETRIRCTCKACGLSDAVGDAVEARFKANLHNHYDAAKKINPKDVQKEEQEKTQEESEEIALK